MVYNIKDFGGVGNGTADNTKALQDAINKCSESGGGTVLVDNGIYKIGTIYFRSDVMLEISRNAKLIAQTERKYYTDDTHYQLYRNETHMDLCLFFAKDCTNIGVTGRGVIDGQGAEFSTFRPMMFRYLECENIHISQVTLRNPASWTNAFIGCRDVWVDGIEISSRANNNGDGVDFDACENVFVSNSKFDCSDDCICLQNSYDDRVCRNVVITNCIMSSKWAGIRIGLLSCSPIELVTVSNCVFRDIDCSALKIQSSEGSTISQMTFTNLVMQDVQRPLFMTTNRRRERKDSIEEISTQSVIRNMTFSGIISSAQGKNEQLLGENQPSCMIIDCNESDVIENVTLRDIHMQVYGDQTSPHSNFLKIPTHTAKRAECRNYEGTLPATALFIRNGKNIVHDNITADELHPTPQQKIVAVKKTRY